MVIQVTNYVFAPGGAGVGTITFSGYVSIELKNVILITNVTDGEIIYNFRIPGNTGTVAGNVLTLMESTAAMSAGDELQIIYNDPTLTANTSNLATQATLASVLTSLQLLDNIVSGNRALVTEDNSAAIKAAVEALAAIVTGGTLDISGTVSISGPVTEANSAAILAAALAIQTATELLDNTVAGNELQVDVITVPADPFGLNADAAVAAGAAGSMQAKLRRLTTDIDAIKTATQALAAIITGGTLDVSGTVTADAGAGWATSGLGLEATLQLIKTATEAVAAIITGGTLDISGTVTADAGNNLNTSALALEATMQSILTGIGQIEIAIEIIDNAISGNEMQVDVITLPIATKADDATTPDNPVMIGGQAKNFDGTDPGNVSAEDDVVRGIYDLNRREFVNTVHPQYWSYHEDSSSALTDTTVKADPGDNYAIFVTDIVVSIGAATAFNIFFEVGANKVLGPYYLEAINGRGFSIHFTTPKQITPSEALTVTTSAAIAHSIDVTGFIARVT